MCVMVITVEVFAPRPADLTQRLLTSGLGFETNPLKPDAGYAVLVKLTDGEEPIRAVERAGKALGWPLFQRMAWSDPWDLDSAYAAGDVTSLGLPNKPGEA